MGSHHAVKAAYCRELQPRAAAARSRPVNSLIARLAALTETFQERAVALDAAGAFPAANIDDLRRIGALSAPLPTVHGGMGAGTAPGGAALALDMLRLIGRGHLATGRLFEAHVNAIKLVSAYGNAAQIRRVADDVAAGALFGLWVTEVPPGLRVEEGVLRGEKSFCSGAGHVRHAVVTAQPAHGEPVLAVVALDDASRARRSATRLTGMRSAVTGSIDLTGLVAEIVGVPGDYLRQPEFSAGAWRTSAVTLGGLEALVGHVRRELRARGRADGPHQLARVGALLIAQRSAGQFVGWATSLAEGGRAAPGDVAAGVNLARIAVERAVLEALDLAQRALGLSAFVVGHPVEALMRDLATYLRQPAPDETLTEAASWFMDREMPA